MIRPASPLNALDLFCGCGGFTLGLQRAGFRVLAAIDFNPEAIATLRANLVEQRHPGLIPVDHAIEADLTQFPPEQLAALLRDPLAHTGEEDGRRPGEGAIPRVDVIVGGPPCQGFSTARQRDGANHGHRRLVHDPRRLLYREFLRYVAFFKPRVFVMENVLGIRSAAGGEYLTRVQKEARELGYRVHGQIEDAWELGVPQKRRRQLFIGVRLDVPGYFVPHLRPAPRVVGQVADLPVGRASVPGFGTGGRRPPEPADRRSAPHFTLGDALGDLPPLRTGGGQFEADYDPARRCDHVERRGEPARRYLVDVLEIDWAEKLTNHVARPHSERDLRDFARLREGENSATAMRERGVEFEFPYDKSSFKDRFIRQHRDRPCSTIVAHLSKDGLMFIHPTQNRSLTPREAARVQSFPDWFVFPRAQTHAFRLIGNAVPPLAQRTETPHCVKNPAVESNHCGGRVSSSRIPSGIQMMMPSRARVSRTRYLLRMNSRVAAFCTTCQALPLN